MFEGVEREEIDDAGSQRQGDGLDHLDLQVAQPRHSREERLERHYAGNGRRGLRR